MAFESIPSEHGEIRIVCEENLTIENTPLLLKKMREAFDASDRIVFEFKPGVEVDVTGIQVICSACKSAAKAGKAFSYIGVLPQALLEMISASGATRSSICKHNNSAACIWFGGA